MWHERITNDNGQDVTDPSPYCRCYGDRDLTVAHGQLYDEMNKIREAKEYNHNRGHRNCHVRTYIIIRRPRFVIWARPPENLVVLDYDDDHEQR